MTIKTDSTPESFWPFVHDNVLVDREIDNLRGNGFEFHFPGRIKIVLRELEIPGFVVGRDFDTMKVERAIKRGIMRADNPVTRKLTFKEIGYLT